MKQRHRKHLIAAAQAAWSRANSRSWRPVAWYKPRNPRIAAPLSPQAGVGSYRGWVFYDVPPRPWAELLQPATIDPSVKLLRGEIGSIDCGFRFVAGPGESPTERP